jgi:prepilin-type N-terminal cleavage/methylation domain-containing protein
MTKSNLSKGFTLIELLVVIAIIGLLSSIVLASLNTARSKADDSAVKSNLSQLARLAALYFNNYESYGSSANNTSCTQSGTIFTDTSVVNQIYAAQNASGGTAVCASSSGFSSKYAIAVPLKSNSSQYWCVDSSGNAKIITNTSSMTTNITCP